MEDLELLRRCFKREKSALDIFIQKYSRLIYTYIHQTLKSQNYNFTEEEVSDIFQDIFVLLFQNNFKKLKSFKARNNCSLASWLRQVVINFTLDYLKKLRPAVSIEEEDQNGLSLKDFLPTQYESQRDLLLKKERISQLEDCINSLEEEEKYFLELHFNQGLNLEILRLHFKISRSAVDMRKARILEKLRECFKKRGFIFM
ncbi:MAG: sigma-70 family RNA polymerase sigma factor [Candidatus Omnitrophica bacterium]|nr:sigma-70 family RNA polymerase sigma factor [Candidatus Omnitrophota bacterium]